MRLIEQVWFKKPILKWPIIIALLPLTCLFYLITTIRRIGYKWGLLSTGKPLLPVIVVGNIGVGGNGKTPVVLYLISLCQQLGIKVGVISRGYGGKAQSYPYVLSPESSADQGGDEPVLIYQRTKVPVAVGADRNASCEALKSLGCELIISDDGLQHYRLARSLELLVVDGNRRFGNGFLLPAGPLREGQWRVETVDHIIVNGGQAKNNEISMSLKAEQVCNIKTGEAIPLQEFVAQYSQVNAAAGIGDPDRFFNMLIQLDFKVLTSKSFVDHHHFCKADFDGFDSKTPLLMTEKDKVKCLEFAQDNWWYLPVNAKMSEQDSKKLINDIQRLTNLVR